MVALGEDPSLQGDCTFPGWQVTRETLPVIGVNSGIPMILTKMSHLCTVASICRLFHGLTSLLQLRK